MRRVMTLQLVGPCVSEAKQNSLITLKPIRHSLCRLYKAQKVCGCNCVFQCVIVSKGTVKANARTRRLHKTQSRISSYFNEPEGDKHGYMGSNV